MTKEDKIKRIDNCLNNLYKLLECSSEVANVSEYKYSDDKLSIETKYKEFLILVKDIKSLEGLKLFINKNL